MVTFKDDEKEAPLPQRPGLIDKEKSAKLQARAPFSKGMSFKFMKYFSKRELFKPSDKDNLPEKDDSKTKVKFGYIEVRAYRTTCGFNPSVSSGPPVELSWEFIQSAKVNIDIYEAKKDPKTGKPEIDVPRLTPAERVLRLRNAGNSDADIIESIEETDKARVERQKTVKAYYFGRNIKRKVYRAYTFVVPAKLRHSNVAVLHDTKNSID